MHIVRSRLNEEVEFQLLDDFKTFIEMCTGDRSKNVTDLKKLFSVYVCTNSMDFRVLHQRVIIAQLEKKFTFIYGI
jgi:hypothetical protein